MEHESIQFSAIILASGVVTLFATLLVAVIVTIRRHRRDDGFTPIGEAEPPPPARSPFATPRGRDGQTR